MLASFRVFTTFVIGILTGAGALYGETRSYRPEDIGLQDITAVSAYQPEIRNGEKLTSGGWGDQYLAFVRFELEGLPKSADRVALRLWSMEELSSGTGSDTWTKTELTVHSPARQWSETDQQAVWDVGASLSMVPQASRAAQWIEIDITDFFNRWQGGSLPNFGIRIGSAHTNAARNVFASSEYPDAALRPTLVITTGPSDATGPSVAAIHGPDLVRRSGRSGSSDFSAGPSDAVVEEAVRTRLPGNLKIHSIEYAVYPDGSGFGGRLSIVGEARVAEDLYGPIDPSTYYFKPDYSPLIADVSARGVPGQYVVLAASRGNLLSEGLNNVAIYKTTTFKDTAVPFSAELRYQETVSGHEVSGGLHVASTPGQPLGDLRNAVVLGSARYAEMVENIVASYNRINDALNAGMSGIEEALGSEVAEFKFPLDRENPVSLLGVQMNDKELAWSADDYRGLSGLLYLRRTFALDTEANVLAPFTMNGHGYQPDERLLVTLKGSIAESTDQPRTIELFLRDVNGQIQSITGPLYWTDTGFQSTPSVPGSGWHVETPERINLDNSKLPAPIAYVLQMPEDLDPEKARDALVDAAYSARTFYDDNPELDAASFFLGSADSKEDTPTLTLEGLENWMIESCVSVPNPRCLTDVAYILGERYREEVGPELERTYFSEGSTQTSWFGSTNLFGHRAAAGRVYAELGLANQALETFHRSGVSDGRFTVVDRAAHAPEYAYALTRLGQWLAVTTMPPQIEAASADATDGEKSQVDMFLAQVLAAEAIGNLANGDVDAFEKVADGVEPSKALDLLATYYNGDVTFLLGAKILLNKCREIGGFTVNRCSTSFVRLMGLAGEVDSAMELAPEHFGREKLNLLRSLIDGGHAFKADRFFAVQEELHEMVLANIEISRIRGAAYLEDARELVKKTEHPSTRNIEMHVLAAEFVAVDDQVSADSIIAEIEGFSPITFPITVTNMRVRNLLDTKEFGSAAETVLSADIPDANKAILLNRVAHSLLRTDSH